MVPQTGIQLSKLVSWIQIKVSMHLYPLTVFTGLLTQYCFGLADNLQLHSVFRQNLNMAPSKLSSQERKRRRAERVRKARASLSEHDKEEKKTSQEQGG